MFDAEGVRHDIGYVKIAQFEMGDRQRSPELSPEFEALAENFFSLGQDDSYYDDLNSLGDEMRDSILNALRDLAALPELWEKARDEPVVKVSLLRSVTEESVKGQFRRLARGGARLTRFKFSYTPPKRVGGDDSGFVLKFDVKPESFPPTNIHVLIGRNGVGKTYLLNLMTTALLGEAAASRQSGFFLAEDGQLGDSLPFANFVFVTFSAFDPFEPFPEKEQSTKHIKYAYVGLKKPAESKPGSFVPKSHRTLGKEFVKSLEICLQGARANRWRRALKILEADPIFKDADATSLADKRMGEKREREAASLFSKLSSGHKIVLLTMTRLVETVGEKTLVVLDEPEAHLHPPLLSGFVRALCELLIDRNGVAIIATHSPVVLQEVPKSCVWKLRRAGAEVAVDRPEIETFGENVSVLTREVFGLEVTRSGFHKMLEDSVADHASYESALESFKNELGAEAKAILRGLFAAKHAELE